MSTTGSASKKPLVTVGAIGADRVDKKSLTAAISKVLALRRGADFRGVDQIGSTPEDRLRGFTTVKYETATRQYTHVDFADHRSYSKNMIIGTTQLDGAIWMVEAIDGATDQALEQVRLARQANMPTLVVFCNNVEGIEEYLIKELQQTIREELIAYGFPGDQVPILCGSVLEVLECASSDPNASEYACIWELMRAVDAFIPTPTPLADRPFLMPIEDVFTIKDRDTVVTGRIERGQVKVGDEMEIVGLRSTRKTAVVGIEMFRKMLEQAVAGDNVGCFVRGIAKDTIERGMVLAKPGTITPGMEFGGEFYINTREEGGRHTPLISITKCQCSLRNVTMNVTAQLPPGVNHVNVGNYTQLSVQLVSPVALQIGDRFTLRDGRLTLGTGVITKT